MRLLMIAALLATGLGPQAIMAQEISKLAPSSPWNLDYSDDSCALGREFSDGTEKVLLEMRQFSPGDTFKVMVASDGRSFKEKAPKVRFAPNPTSRTIERPLFLVFNKTMEAVMWSDSFFPEDVDVPSTREVREPPPIRSEAAHKAREAAVEGVEVRGTFSPAIFLATGEMHKPMQAMRKCLEELVTHWGVDVAAHRTLSRWAWPAKQAQWAQQIQAAYPSAMLEKMKSGLVRVRMMVGADGRPTSCHIQMPAQDPAFEATACREMMKASRFSPALDAAGRPIASFYTTAVVYMVN